MQLTSAVFLALAVLSWIAAQDPVIKYTLAAPEVVQARLDRFGSTDAEREATLKSMFADAGCEGELTEQAVKGSRLPNVICTLVGSGTRTIIVGAHYDHVAAGHGVVDNWSGASLLPSLYAALKSEPRSHTFIFIGFTDEERGEIGSRYYVHHMTKEQVAAIDAMVNMDTLGLSAAEVDASHADKRLLSEFFAVARGMALPASAMNIPDEIGSTDSDQFRERKIPSIAIHSLTQASFNARILHTSKDQLSAIRFGDYYDTYKLVGAFLAHLDALQNAPSKH